MDTATKNRAERYALDTWGRLAPSLNSFYSSTVIYDKLPPKVKAIVDRGVKAQQQTIDALRPLGFTLPTSVYDRIIEPPKYLTRIGDVSDKWAALHQEVNNENTRLQHTFLRPIWNNEISDWDDIDTRVQQAVDELRAFIEAGLKKTGLADLIDPGAIKVGQENKRRR